MILFTSKRERKLWYWSGVACAAILSGIWLAGSLAEFLRDRGWLTNAFWIAIILVLMAIAINGFRTRPSGIEVMVWVGLAAVYLLVALRMNAPEARSHLIEYCVLALLILEALRERARNDPKLKYVAWRALGLTTAIGMLDEAIQILVPTRVFDWIDILFDFMAAGIAIGGSMILEWVRKKVAKSIS